MAFDYDRIKNWAFAPITVELTSRDIILYALSVGYGADPLDTRELPFVYERILAVAPTFCTVLGSPGFWMADPSTGIAADAVLHAEQRVTLHAPFPISGTVTSQPRIDRIVDKGPEVGALVYQHRTLYHHETDVVVASVEHTTFCRADGGFSGTGDDPPPRPQPVPTRPPDQTCDLPTLRQAALIHRLMGDLNPLHIDPAVAAKAGYSQPILHGVATFGVAGHAVLKTCCDYQPERLRSVFARFAAPVIPGDVLRTEMWQEDTFVHFQVRVRDSGTIVLSHGLAELTDA